MNDATFLAVEMRRSTRNLLVTFGLLAAPALALVFASREPAALGWALILGGGAGVTLVAALVRLPAGWHPTWRAARRYGAPEEIGREIGLELAGREAATIGRLTVTPHWLLERRVYGIELSRLEDVAWAYRLDTQHSTNGIKTGRTIEVKIHLRSGRCLKVNAGRDTAARQMLEQVRTKAPWAITGYSPDLEAVWNGARGEFLAQIDSRKARAAEAGSGTASAASVAPPAASVPLPPSPKAGAVFALGLLGLFTPLGIAAWILGHVERRAVRDGHQAPSTLLNAGWALGIAGTVIFYGLMMLVAAHHAPATSVR